MSSETQDLSLGKAVALTLVAVGLFFLLLEGVLALFGLQPVGVQEDPFVGFAANAPLFVEKGDTDGRPVLVTAANKHLFNRQEFPRDKAPGTYRIFCLGGSTTYGRPYDDSVSFAAWLRELLPAADPGRRWEIVNAGAISYASYRVTRLMQELVEYEPDLFVIYTGHNEFLEERSYGALRDTPGAVRAAASVLSRTRTWAAMSRLLDRAGALPATKPEARTELAAEADTMLERFGPAAYKRDDALRKEILLHYRISLRRMAEIARSAGAAVIFVTPASNLKDCSPFKSEHTEGLGEAERARTEELLAQAVTLLHESRAAEALAALDEALSVDPRFADLHYRRGKALLHLGRHEEAKAAFERARDEDVCALRALSPMRRILADVARETDTPLVDFVDLLEERIQVAQGHTIPGEDFFVDHVHPTIGGNGVLAARLVQEMVELGELGTARPPGPEVVASAGARIEERLTPWMRAKSLSNLAQVIAWAGKTEDAGGLALQALAYEPTDPDVISPAASIVATYAAMEGDVARERKYYQMALNATPRSAKVHFRLGLRCLDREPRELEAGVGHIFFASVFWPGEHRDEVHRILGRTLAERHRYAAALSHLLEARRLNPGHRDTETLVSVVRAKLEPNAAQVAPLKITLEKYPSGALEKIVQVRVDASGKVTPDGLWTEWYEGGELKRLVDYVDGVPDGYDMTWSPRGEVTEHTMFVRGNRVPLGE